MNRQSATIYCPRALVGRIIGKNGETIKALQSYTGAMIQIDQTCEPTQVGVSGTTQSMALALSMIADIIKGNFRGFALLRQCVGQPSVDAAGASLGMTQPLPVYVPGYGLVPPTQGVIVNAAVPPGMMPTPGMSLLHPYSEAFMDPSAQLYSQQPMAPSHMVMDMTGTAMPPMASGAGLAYAVRPGAPGAPMHVAPGQMQPPMMMMGDPTQAMGMASGHARLFASTGRRPPAMQPMYNWSGEVGRPGGPGMFADLLHPSPSNPAIGNMVPSASDGDSVYQFDIPASEQQRLSVVKQQQVNVQSNSMPSSE